MTQLCSNLSDNKALLDIPNKLIRFANQLSIPFTYIFNQSVTQGIVPNVLKVSGVTSVFKSDDVTDPTNYRPIAVLSPFNKILEKIVNDQLISFLDKNNTLFQHQFGFEKDHCTELAILEISDNLKTAIDNNHITCGLFLDFSNGLTWSTMRYSYGNYQVCGVTPPRIDRRPLLFLLYINDLPNSSDNLSFRLFAHDANIFYSTKEPKDLETVIMNSELQKVLNYCNPISCL